MKAPLFNLKGDRVGELEVPDAIFAAPWKPQLVRQATIAQAANRRQPLAHAKTRGEVSGGGKKPWKQKGTGRARHGSIRSPIWKGGGVTHGPRNDRDFSVKINKNMRVGAIRSIISKKLKDGDLQFINSLDIQAPKTKILASTLQTFLKVKKSEKKLSTLLIPRRENGAIHRAAANMPSVKAVSTGSLNVEDLLKYRHVLLEERAVAEMKA